MKLQINSSPLVDPVKKLGADAGIVPILGFIATLQIFDGIFNVVIQVQKFSEFGLIVYQTLPYPLDPTVIQSSPDGENIPFVTELASPYSVAAFWK